MRYIPFSVLLGNFFYVAAIWSTSATWIGPNTGDWSNAANWNPTIPDASGDTATFTDTGTHTISLNSASAQNITIGALTINSTSTYTIQSGIAGNSLIFDTLSGSASIAIQGATGNRTITCPIQQNVPLTITSSAQTSSTISGNITMQDLHPLSISTTNSGAWNVSGSISGNSDINTQTTANGNCTISGNISGNGTLTVDTGSSTATTIISGTISGARTLVKIGSGGTLRLGGSTANTYTGQTQVQEGTITYFTPGAIPSNGQVIIGLNNQPATLNFSNMDMAINNAFALTINNQGVVSQSNNHPIYLISLSGTTAGANLGMSIGSLSTSLLDITGGTDCSYAGQISLGAASTNSNPGAGCRLNKGGSSTLTLSGNSTYVARTFITQGVIAAQSSNALGIPGNASAVYVLSDGAAAFGTLRLDNAITLNKVLFLNGPGHLSQGALRNASGSNTVSGNITIGWAGGTQTAQDATIQVDSGTNLTLSGVVSGTNNLTKGGTGTLVYSGSLANTMSGMTTIDEGILQLSKSGVPAIAGNVQVNSGATLIFDQTGTITYGQALSGPGDLIKQNSGTIILTNTNTIGTTAVNSGTLTVNGSLAGGGSLTVAGGALLNGTGTLTKNAVISGTLAPGNSIGTINFIGNQTLANGSTLEIEISPSAHDLVNVEGTFTIQPGANLSVLPDAGTYNLPSSYPIVQTTEGVFGTFSNVTNAFPLIAVFPTYTPLDVILNLSFFNFADFFTTGNTGAVAHCLDHLAQASSDFSFIVDNLRHLPTLEEISNALLQMQPSAFTSLTVAQENDTLYVQNTINHRMEEYTHTCPDDIRVSKKGQNVWLVPFFGHTSQHSQHQEPGYIANAPGAFLGLDAPIASNSRLGGGAGYTYTHLDWKMSRGKAHLQTIYASLYGRFIGNIGYLESSLIGSYSFYSTSRHIGFGSINRHAKGRHHGIEGAIDVKAALTFKKKATLIEPFIRADYMYVHESAFHEHGAGSLNLYVESKNSDFLMSEGGLELSHCCKLSNTTLTPFLQLSAIRESRFQGKHEKASFEEGCSMRVSGLYPSRTLGGIEAGIDTMLSNSSLSIFYKGKYGKNFQDNSIYFQARFSF